MTEKQFLSGMPPRCGKTATMEALQKINDSIVIDHKIDIPCVEVNVDLSKIITAAATKYHCPVCGSNLLLDFEEGHETVLFCPKCRKRVKAKKMSIDDGLTD